MFNPFKPNCKICGSRRRLFGSAKIMLQAADGTKQIKVCDSCENTVAVLYQLKNGYDSDPLPKEK